MRVPSAPGHLGCVRVCTLRGWALWWCTVGRCSPPAPALPGGGRERGPGSSPLGDMSTAVTYTHPSLNNHTITAKSHPSFLIHTYSYQITPPFIPPKSLNHTITPKSLNHSQITPITLKSYHHRQIMQSQPNHTIPPKSLNHGQITSSLQSQPNHTHHSQVTLITTKSHQSLPYRATTDKNTITP